MQIRRVKLSRKLSIIAPRRTSPLYTECLSGLRISMLKLDCRRKPILQQISVRSGHRKLLNASSCGLGRTKLFLGYHCERGNSSATPEPPAHGLSLAAGGRPGRAACAVGVSRVSLGDEKDL